MKIAPPLNREELHMKRIQNSWQKLFGCLILAFLIIAGISACNTNANTTVQICNGVVNVNSCTSNNSDVQNTVIAGWQLQTSQEQATAQANLDATVVAQSSVQHRTTKEENIVSIGNIVIPLAFFISIIAFFASFSEDQESVTVKIVTAIIAVLLLIMLILIWSK